MAIRARDFLDELANSITWLEPTALLLAERRGNAANRCNWAATTTLCSDLTRNMFEDVTSKWRASALDLDWADAAFDGDQRAMILWLFPPGGEVDRFLVSGSRPEKTPPFKPHS